MKRRGSAVKPARLFDTVRVSYSREHWALLQRLRRDASAILSGLGDWTDSAVAHGSLARGDVDAKSDVDILIPFQVSTSLLASRLELAGLNVYAREIAQATPVHSPKAHLHLDYDRLKSVTVPLAPFRRHEQEFYAFGGMVTADELRRGVRRPGCSKKLALIEPTNEGHVESPVVGRESQVARVLRVSVDLVRERVRVLTRRDSVGRTGVFLKLSVPENVSFEEVLRGEAASNPALRRTLRMRGAT